MRIRTPLRRQAPTEDVELSDLLDRILDKGLFLGSANMLLLGETNLSHPGTHMSVGSMQTVGLPDVVPSATRPGARTRRPK